jgi:predicted nuclease of restriction endonuclease-like (RecB) superfamily
MTKGNAIISIDATYRSIKTILEKARKSAYRAVNFAMVQAYWNVGRLIVEDEQKGKAKAEYGKFLIKELSKKLIQDFGKGFSEQNLRNFRQFYLAFPIHHAMSGKLEKEHKVPSKTKNQDSNEIRYALRSELSWTHYRLLMRIEKESVRRFYMEECIQNNWSSRQLERQINSFYYERILSSKNKELVRRETLDHGNGMQPEDIIKDPYVLEFLELRENRDYLENELEQGLINNLHDFLLELGKGFSFVARQKRITVDGDHFYIDLVFYNYILKCFVLVDLKVGKLTHQDIGQMDFYVRYFEQEIKLLEDNPTIGLILCAEKNESMAKYTLLQNNKNIFASKYKLYLPTEEELIEELERGRRYLELKIKESHRDVE